MECHVCLHSFEERRGTFFLQVSSYSFFSIAKEGAVCLVRSLFHRSLSVPAACSAPGVRRCDLWHCVFPFIASAGTTGTVRWGCRWGGSLKNWRILSCKYKEMWGWPHGISPVGLACKIFISSAYDSSRGCVLRKCLTAFICPVLSRVSLCSVALPWAILLGTAPLPLSICSALYCCHAKL